MLERDDRILMLPSLFQKVEHVVSWFGETVTCMMATLIFGSYVSAAATKWAHGLSLALNESLKLGTLGGVRGDGIFFLYPGVGGGAWTRCFWRIRVGLVADGVVQVRKKPLCF